MITNLSVCHEEPRRWAEDHFADAEVSDVRRGSRVVTIAEAMAHNPGLSIPQLFAHPYDVKAAYHLLNHPDATPDNLQAGDRDLVIDQMHRPGLYLLIEDTTEMSFSGKQPIAGLGSIGNGAEGLQGFFLHSVLAVGWRRAAAPSNDSKRPAVEVIGLCDQQYFVRQRRPKGQPRESSQQRKYRDRESRIWEQAGERIGPAPEGVRWIRVGDREADIYEHLRSCQRLGHGFCVRAAKDRALINAHTAKREGRLFEVARRAEPLGEFELELRSRPNKAARIVKLQVSATSVKLSSPWRPGHGPGSQPSINCTVVRVWEEETAGAGERLEWVLLCDGKVDSFEQARECARQYSTRWLIEEYHKALKSGLGAERLQLESAEGLFAAIAIMSVVALRLIDLRERVRINPDGAAEEAGLAKLDLEVLRARTGRKIDTVREVALAIGRLGGHLNRKGDGLPGWQTLWRGMEKLSSLVEGVRIAHKLISFG
jgi:hypothetical protein